MQTYILWKRGISYGSLQSSLYLEDFYTIHFPKGIYRVSGHSVSHFDSIFEPFKGGIFQSVKGESYFFCLKKIPSDFRGGVYYWKFGATSILKKRVKNGNFS